MRLSVRLSSSLIVAVATVSLLFGLFQAKNTTRGLERDLEQHALILAQSLEKSAEPLVLIGSNRDIKRLVDRFQSFERLAGVAVYDMHGKTLAMTQSLAAQPEVSPPPVVALTRDGGGHGEFFQIRGVRMHVFALPVKADSAVLGTVAVFHDASYIDWQTSSMWRRLIARVAVETLVIVIVTLLALRWGLGRPVDRLVLWLREMRGGRKPVSRSEFPKEAMFGPLAHEITQLVDTLTVARAAAEEEARLRDAGESTWTPERLRVSVESKLQGTRLFAISHREPYEHTRNGGEITVSVPASGLVTALEPILRACEGTWIASATGDADRETVDDHDRLRVPPNHPQYTLRRVFLTQEEEDGFYLGFSNEGLWPLCHIAHTRPTFRTEDWEHYKRVNQRFADVLLEEVENEENPMILVQDYHFALVPRMVKDARPDARVAIFWHIPWPNPEAFAICPWQNQLLEGLLGADLIGFHVQAHCNNFLDTIDRTLEARIDREKFAANFHDHLTSVRPFPISVATSDPTVEEPPQNFDSSYVERSKLLGVLGVDAVLMGVGVDRIDYTKGIPERFRGIERFFEKYPSYRRQFTFVQIGAPSRTHIKRYHDLIDEVRAEADRINRRFESGSWKPIVFLPRHHSHHEILPYYRLADLCLVTSLHDGMNLVAKEYVMSTDNSHGALILSRFTGASHELVDALVVNPYDVEELADAIHRAIEMAPEERRSRMMRMRTHIREHNIFRWAGNLIADLAAIRVAPRRPKPPRVEPSDVPNDAHRPPGEHLPETPSEKPPAAPVYEPMEVR